jgi:hypothetical protein
MSFPDFFDQAPTITVHDGLAEFLGACTDGMITYRYIDAVRLAGHSCPTVAGAYLMTRRALNALYPDGTPERGALKVRFAAAQDAGVSGVIGSVVGLITGAAGIGGFKGIGGKFQRQHLLQFGAGDDGEVVFERGDNGTAVQLSMHMNRVAADPGMNVLLRKVLDGLATPDDNRAFAALWQARVKRILIDHADDPGLFTVTTIAPQALA